MIFALSSPFEKTTRDSPKKLELGTGRCALLSKLCRRWWHKMEEATAKAPRTQERAVVLHTQQFYRCGTISRCSQILLLPSHVREQLAIIP